MATCTRCGLTLDHCALCVLGEVPGPATNAGPPATRAGDDSSGGRGQVDGDGDVTAARSRTRSGTQRTRAPIVVPVPALRVDDQL